MTVPFQVPVTPLALPADFTAFCDAHDERCFAAQFTALMRRPVADQAALAFNSPVGWSWVFAHAYLVALLPYYCQHALGPFAGLAAIPVYTEASWLAAAGIPYGFRQAFDYNPDVNVWTNYSDPMYFYRTSPPQGGEIFGRWILADLHAALSAQKWTVRTGGITGADRAEVSGIWTGRPHACDVYGKRRDTGFLDLLESQPESLLPDHVATVPDLLSLYSAVYWVLKWNFTNSD